jgi:hypothetical protein
MKSRILKHIPNTACPICGAGIQCETFQGRTYVNGQQFESITFQCGGSISWVPNFERSEITSRCPEDPEILLSWTRKEKIKNAIWNALAGINITDKERSAIERFLSNDL